MFKRNLLITCGGGVYTRSIIEVLKKNNDFQFILCDSDKNAKIFESSLNTKIYTVPSADLHSKDDFIEAISLIVHKEKINYILPMSDKEALYLKNSKFELITLAADKKLCYLFSSKYSTIQNLNKFFNQKYFIKLINKENIHLLKKELDQNKLYCLKPNIGRGGKGFKILGYKLPLKKNNEKFIKFDQLENNFFDSSFDEYIVMDFFVGQDFNIDVSCDMGRLIDISIQRRDAPHYGPITSGAIVKDELIYNFVCEFVYEFKASGIFNIELIKTDMIGNNFKNFIYEINPRASAALSFTEALNPGYIERAIKILEGVKVSPSLFLKSKNAKIRRVWFNEIV